MTPAQALAVATASSLPEAAAARAANDADLQARPTPSRCHLGPSSPKRLLLVLGGSIEADFCKLNE